MSEDFYESGKDVLDSLSQEDLLMVYIQKGHDEFHQARLNKEPFFCAETERMVKESEKQGFCDYVVEGNELKSKLRELKRMRGLI